MRFRPLYLALIVLLLCGANFAWAQLLPFGEDKLPTVTFTENYTDTVISGPFGYESVPDSSLSFTLTASMKNVVVEDMIPADGSGIFTLNAGNLALSLNLMDAVQTQTTTGYTVYTWIWTVPDEDTGEPVTFGTVTFQYNAAKDLKVTASFADNPSEYSIYAAEEAYADEVLEDLTAKNITFSVGAYGFENITLYINGTATTFDQTVGSGDDQQTFTGLAKVRLTGLIDKDLPVLKITSPAVRATVTELPATLTGTWTDAHGIFQIEVQLNDGVFEPATLAGNGWNISLPDLLVGANTVTVRATDIDGHVTQATRTFNYSLMSNLTVTVAGDAGGKVTSSFFNPLNFDPAKNAPKSVTKQKEGTSLVVVASAGPTAVFDGWTSNKDALTDAQKASARLSFKHEPNLILTAHFKLNPFTPVKGRYTGLGLGPSVAGTALFSMTLNTNGTFTGSLKVGAVNLPLKGKFSNEGHYTASISSGKITYAVDLALNVSGIGERKITGTIVGGAVNVTVDSDLSPFDGKALKATQVGTYNVILPPLTGQADPYPAGIGFGRVTVAASGTVKFVGRLGSGTSLTASSRLSTDGEWPFFALLYGKKGVIAGTASFDLTAPESDVTGAFNWFKPADVKPGAVFPESFSGQSSLIGALYTKPLAGQRVMLEANGGLGQLTLDAPATIGAVPLPALQATLDASLGLNHKLTATAAGGSAVTTAQAAFNAGTGIFSGNFMEGTVKRTVQGIVVPGPKVNRAAGYFLRAPRSGAVNLLPPPPPSP